MEQLYEEAYERLRKYIQCKPQQFVTPENINALIGEALKIFPGNEELLFLKDYVAAYMKFSKTLNKESSGNKVTADTPPSCPIGSDVFFVVQGVKLAAKVAAYTFTDYGKVLYDLRISTGLGKKGDEEIFTMAHRVDSLFVVPWENSTQEIKKGFPECKELAL